MEYGIDILAAVGVPRSLVLVFLPGDLEPCGSENLAQLLCNFAVLFTRQCLDFVLVSIENVMLATSKVGMYLAWKQGVLGNICVSRVLIQRK